MNLIPSSEEVMGILRSTAAFREGHFVYPNGKHAPHYFQMPLAFRNYDTARILAVALSRLFRTEKTIASLLPKVAVVSPSPGGIPVAFGVREALSAQQIYWAEPMGGKRMFRQFIQKGEFNPCIIVDDIIRSGSAITETIHLLEDLGATVVGCGSIVRYHTAPQTFGDVHVKSLVEFEDVIYDSAEDGQSVWGQTPAEQLVF